MREITRVELDALIDKHCSTSALMALSTTCFEDIEQGVALDGKYRGELVSCVGGRVVVHVPLANNNDANR